MFSVAAIVTVIASGGHQSLAAFQHVHDVLGLAQIGYAWTTHEHAGIIKRTSYLGNNKGTFIFIHHIPPNARSHRPNDDHRIT